MKVWTTDEEAANLKRLLSTVKSKAEFAEKAGIPGGSSMWSPSTKAATGPSVWRRALRMPRA